LHVVLVRLPYLPPIQRHPALIERLIPRVERPAWASAVESELLQPIIAPLLSPSQEL
jgi:hypothetical protein